MPDTAIPTADLVLIRPHKRQEQTKNGLHLPEMAVEHRNEGVIVEVGPGRVLENGELARVRLSKGDHVCYGKYAGDPVTLDDIEHLLLRESEVLAIIHRETP